MDLMRFGAGEFLWILALVPGLVILAWAAAARRRGRLRRFVAPEILPRLLVGASTTRSIARAAVQIGTVGLFVVALARPQWGRRDEPVLRRGVDVVLALDLSSSMLAEDMSPNRLEQAKMEARTLLDSLTGDRVGFVVFGGRAAVQCPLTLDYGAVRLFLDAAEPDVAPGPGTDLARAIEEAARLFSPSERRYKTVVLLTDGEDLEGRGLEAAKRAREDGIVIHAIGAGTVGGGPIPLRDEAGTLTGYKKDRQGRVVTSRYDPAGLEAIVEASGGAFFQAGPAGEEGRKVADAIARMEKKEIASRLATRFEDRFQIPLGLGLLLLGVGSIGVGWRPRRAAAGGLAMTSGTRPARGGPADRGGRKDQKPADDQRWKGDGADAAGTARQAEQPMMAARAGGHSASASPGPAALLVLAAMGLALLHGGFAIAQDGQRAAEAPAAGERADSGAGGGERGNASAAPAGAAGAAAPREDKTPSAAVARRNREGNRHYEQGQFGDALSRYEEASAAAPDLPSLRYNIGNALYREGKFDQAASEYARALSRSGAGLAPSARYNLGNAQYQQKHYEEAADAYRKVLDQAPQDEAARRNLELALRMLKQKQEQQKQSQQDKQQDKQKDKQQQPGASAQSKEDKKDKDPSKPESGKNDQPSGDDKKKEEPDPSSDQGRDKDARPAQGNEGKIGRKEAERLLDSLAQEEKRDLKKRLARMPREEGPEKDW